MKLVRAAGGVAARVHLLGGSQSKEGPGGGVTGAGRACPLANLGKLEEGSWVIVEVLNVKHGLGVRQLGKLLRKASVDAIR